MGKLGELELREILVFIAVIDRWLCPLLPRALKAKELAKGLQTGETELKSSASRRSIAAPEFSKKGTHLDIVGGESVQAAVDFRDTLFDFEWETGRKGNCGYGSSACSQNCNPGY